MHRVGLHELGHALGLDYPDDARQSVVAIMNSHATELDQLAADDISGVQCLYGAPVNAPPPTQHGRLANISTRVRIGTGDDVMIGGFITRDGSKRVLIRARGPSRPTADSLRDPVLELHDGSGAVLASNDNWKQDQQEAIEATTIPLSNELEAAIVATLPPGASPRWFPARAAQAGQHGR